MSAPPGTATDEEIFAAYPSNDGESEPEDAEVLPTVAQPARSRAAKRKKTQVEDEDDGYGSDLYYDEEDRAELMAKTQLEREMILAKRAEERINRTERQKLLAKSKDAEPAPKPPPGKRPDAKRRAMDSIRKAQQRKKSATTKAARWVLRFGRVLLFPHVMAVHVGTHMYVATHMYKHAHGVMHVHMYGYTVHHRTYIKTQWSGC